MESECVKGLELHILELEKQLKLLRVQLLYKPADPSLHFVVSQISDRIEAHRKKLAKAKRE